MKKYIITLTKDERDALKDITMYDRAMQSLYAMALEPIAEATGDRTSFGSMASIKLLSLE